MESSVSATISDRSEEQELLNWNDWKFIVAKVYGKSSQIDKITLLVLMQDIPTQTSNSDCGVFVLSYARCLLFDKPFMFNQVSL